MKMGRQKRWPVDVEDDEVMGDVVEDRGGGSMMERMGVREVGGLGVEGSRMRYVLYSTRVEEIRGRSIDIAKAMSSIKGRRISSAAVVEAAVLIGLGRLEVLVVEGSGDGLVEGGGVERVSEGGEIVNG